MLKEYLEDGVYAEFDGFGVKLSTPREDGEHYIYFEPSTLGSFIRFLEKVYNCKINVVKDDDPEANKK